MKQLQVLAAPVGRVLLALIFVMAGLSKIGQFEGTQGYMEAMGVPGMLLPLVILTEVVGGVLIILGWKTQWAALALAGFSVLTALIFHMDFSNQAEMNSFMKNIAIAGGFLILFANGAGSYSMDNRSKNR